MVMSLYEIFKTYILPLFIDITAFPKGEEVFYYVFLAVSLVVVITIFIGLPFKLILWIANGGKSKKGRLMK